MTRFVGNIEFQRVRVHDPQLGEHGTGLAGMMLEQ